MENEKKKYSFVSGTKIEENKAFVVIKGYIATVRKKEFNGEEYNEYAVAINNANKKLAYNLGVESINSKSDEVIFINCIGNNKGTYPVRNRMEKILTKGFEVIFAGILVRKASDKGDFLNLYVQDFDITRFPKLNENEVNSFENPTNNTENQFTSEPFDMGADIPF